jgi:hypothetical protein
MSRQLECAYCGKEWEWDCEPIFDFSIPVGKRIWPAVCPDCRALLEQKFKSGQLSYNELLLEFSSISARAAKKCAGKVQATLVQTINPGFRPKRRGKN